tara:strand:+ start:1249 stop:2379 length:1131 start_codon:yes stop_codon:yes gene_type:complete
MSNKSKTNKVLISIWADPSNYLNLLFLINYLIKNGKKITLICEKIHNKNDFFYFVENSNKLSVIEINSHGKYGYIKFFIYKICIITKFRFDMMISVNFISLFFSLFSSLFFRLHKTKWIYYNFDFDSGLKFNLNNFIEKIFIKKVDYIFVPSDSRLKLYKKIFNRKKNIYSIYNSFSCNFSIKNKTSLPFKLRNKKFFVRLGSFYKYHGLKKLALATKFWKKDIYLVMAGKSYNNYFKTLKDLKKNNNLRQLILYEDISYKVWFGLLEKAFAGFAFYDPINVSHNLMGGTSQKLNNYIFAGIPSFVTRNTDFKKFNEKNKTSILVNNNSIIDINLKISKILKDKKKYNFLKKKNNEAFKKKFNFETQIEPVKKILS